MISETQVQSVIGSTAYSTDGDEIGRVGQLYLDDSTGQPDFVTVKTGLFGMRESLVPIREASLDGDRLVLPYTKDQVKDAPNVDDHGHLEPADEQRLYEHYRLTPVGHDQGYAAGTDRGTVGRDTSGPETDQAMTRSEEHLEVGTVEREAGRAKLRKYVTTETETRTVPVERERAVVEREPVDSSNVDQALDGPTISEEEHEVVLREQEATARTTAEPVERVRLGKETVRDEETVSEQVRTEHVEVEGDVDPTRRT